MPEGHRRARPAVLAHDARAGNRCRRAPPRLGARQQHARPRQVPRRHLRRRTSSASTSRTASRSSTSSTTRSSRSAQLLPRRRRGGREAAAAVAAQGRQAPSRRERRAVAASMPSPAAMSARRQRRELAPVGAGRVARRQERQAHDDAVAAGGAPEALAASSCADELDRLADRARRLGEAQRHRLHRRGASAIAACSRLAWNGSRPCPVEVVPSGKIATVCPAASDSAIAWTTRRASRFRSRSR